MSSPQPWYRRIHWGKIVAIVLFFIDIALFLVVGMIVFDFRTSFLGINPPSESCTFQIPFGASLSNGSPVGEQDIQIGVTFTYPNGTLYVGDPVNVTAVAVVEATVAQVQNITSFTIGFQNGLAYPPEVDRYGITQFGNIFLDPTGGPGVYVGSGSVYWPVEGTYYTRLAVAFGNNTGKYLGMSSDVAITVYSKEQAVATKTNRISLVLTWALFILTILGAMTGVKDIILTKH